jgi:hypothetical protein
MSLVAVIQLVLVRLAADGARRLLPSYRPRTVPMDGWSRAGEHLAPANISHLWRNLRSNGGLRTRFRQRCERSAGASAR